MTAKEYVLSVFISGLIDENTGRIATIPTS
jgi:hypothetical protein